MNFLDMVMLTIAAINNIAVLYDFVRIGTTQCESVRLSANRYDADRANAEAKSQRLADQFRVYGVRAIVRPVG